VRLPLLLSVLLAAGLALAATAPAQDSGYSPGPTAVLDVRPPNVFTGQIVVLDGSRSFDPDGGPLGHRWDVDGDARFDVNTGPDPQLATAFFTPGPNRVGLQVTDRQSLRDDAFAGVLVFPRDFFADRTPPRIRLSRISRSLRRALRSGLAVRARCSEACVMAASLSVSRSSGRRLGLRGKRRTLGAAFRSVTRAGSRRLVIKLTRTARRKLRRARRVRVTFRFAAADAARNVRQVQRTLVLRR